MATRYAWVVRVDSEHDKQHNIYGVHANRASALKHANHIVEDRIGRGMHNRKPGTSVVYHVVNRKLSTISEHELDPCFFCVDIYDAKKQYERLTVTRYYMSGGKAK